MAKDGEIAYEYSVITESRFTKGEPAIRESFYLEDYNYMFDLELEPIELDF